MICQKRAVLPALDYVTKGTTWCGELLSLVSIVNVGWTGHVVLGNQKVNEISVYLIYRWKFGITYRKR
jgi:hypothetical protein